MRLSSNPLVWRYVTALLAALWLRGPLNAQSPGGLSIPSQEQRVYLDILRIAGNRDYALHVFQMVREVASNKPPIPLPEVLEVYEKIRGLEGSETGALLGFEAVLEAARKYPSIAFQEHKKAYLKILGITGIENTLDALQRFRAEWPPASPKGMSPIFQDLEKLRKQLEQPATPIGPGGENDPAKLFRLPWDSAL